MPVGLGRPGLLPAAAAGAAAPAVRARAGRGRPPAHLAPWLHDCPGAIDDATLARFAGRLDRTGHALTRDGRLAG
jgi:hypothetical protein